MVVFLFRHVCAVCLCPACILFQFLIMRFVQFVNVCEECNK